MEQSGMQGAGVWASLVSCMEKERAEILRKKSLLENNSSMNEFERLVKMNQKNFFNL